MACAYCGGTEKRTKEHIIPGGIIKLFPEFDRVFQQDKVFKGESTVKDVCHICNNGPLSDWDSYGKNLIEDNFLKEYDPCSYRLEYNYSKLSRWLLKMVYNAARAGRWSEVAPQFGHEEWFIDNKEFLIDRSETKQSNLRFTIAGALYQSPPFKLSPIGLTIEPVTLYHVMQNEPIDFEFAENYGCFSPVLIWFGSAMFLIILWKEDTTDDQISKATEELEAYFPYSILKKDEKIVHLSCGVDIVNSNFYYRVHSAALMYSYNNGMINLKPKPSTELTTLDDEDLDLPF